MAIQIRTVTQGEFYGVWQVASDERVDPRLGYVVECVCVCGNRGLVQSRKLIYGLSKSCGCLQTAQGDVAITNLWRAWDSLGRKGRNYWLDWTDFFRWSLRNGYKSTSKLHKNQAAGEHSPTNSYWYPKRVERFRRIENGPPKV